MAAERVDFGGLHGEALQLHEDIVRLRQECINLKEEAKRAGATGADGFRSQRREAGLLEQSISHATRQLATQLGLYKLTKFAISEIRTGLEGLVESAIEFSAAKENAFDPKSFNNLMATLKVGFDSALGRGSFGLFDQIKALLESLGQLVRTATFREAIKLIADGLAAAVVQARTLVSTIDPAGLLEIAEAIRLAISGIAATLAPVIMGLTAGFSDLAKIFRAITAEFGKKIFGDDFAVVLSLLTRISVVILGLGIPIAAIAAALAAIPVTVLILLGVLAGLGAALLGIDEITGGVGVKFGTIRDLIVTDIVFGIEKAAARLKVLLATITRGIAVLRGDDAGAIAANKELERAVSLADQLVADQGKVKTGILEANKSAETFAQAFAAAAAKGTQSIVEFIHKDLPDLKKQLQTREKEDPITIPVQFDTPRISSNAAGGGGVKDWTDEISKNVQTMFTGLTPVVQSFGEIISGTLADALDPGRNSVPIRKRFSDFFKSLPLLLLQAFSGQGGRGAGGFALGGVVPGFALGGHVGRGYASGGPAASDTVPAWLTPGEWVMRLSAVRKYGPRLMSLLNAGVIDPALLNLLAGGRTARLPRPSGGGYATGGEVGSGANVTKVLPVLAVDRHTAASIMSMDEGSVLVEAIARNSSAVKAVLGR